MHLVPSSSSQASTGPAGWIINFLLTSQSSEPMKNSGRLQTEHSSYKLKWNDKIEKINILLQTCLPVNKCSLMCFRNILINKSSNNF